MFLSHTPLNAPSVGPEQEVFLQHDCALEAVDSNEKLINSKLGQDMTTMLFYQILLSSIIINKVALKDPLWGKA